MTFDEETPNNSRPALGDEEAGERPIRIALVEDHGIVREGLRMLVESQEDMVVVAQAATPDEALAIVTREQPDLVLLDLDLAGVNIVENLPQIRAASPETRVLVLTGIRDPHVHRRAVRLGALGLVLKDQAAGTLIKAIRRVCAGEAWIDRSMTARLVADLSGSEEDRLSHDAAKIGTLSRREREIVTVLCEGLSNRQIAERLFISEATVRNHLTSILAKLELLDRFELAIYSYRHGLAKPPH